MTTKKESNIEVDLAVSMKGDENHQKSNANEMLWTASSSFDSKTDQTKQSNLSADINNSFSGNQDTCITKVPTVPVDSPEIESEREQLSDETYECHFCNIIFKDPLMFDLHMGYHGYDNPFKCNGCGIESHDRVEFFIHLARFTHT